MQKKKVLEGKPHTRSPQKSTHQISENEAHRPGHPHYEQNHKPKKEEPLFENPTPEVPPEVPLEIQTIKDPDDINIIEAKIKIIEKVKDKTRQDLAGLENQLYVLQQLIKPETNSNDQKTEKPPQGLPAPDGAL